MLLMQGRRRDGLTNLTAQCHLSSLSKNPEPSVMTDVED